MCVCVCVGLHAACVYRSQGTGNTLPTALHRRALFCCHLDPFTGKLEQPEPAAYFSFQSCDQITSVILPGELEHPDVSLFEDVNVCFKPLASPSGRGKKGRGEGRVVTFGGRRHYLVEFTGNSDTVPRRFDGINEVTELSK